MIKEVIQVSIEVKIFLLQDVKLLQEIEIVVQVCIEVYWCDGKVLFCGNGGSVVDVQYLVVELFGCFYFDCLLLFVEVLYVNMFFVMVVGNDYGYDVIYVCMVEVVG